jgi:hypothetical protein
MGLVEYDIQIPVTQGKAPFLKGVEQALRVPFVQRLLIDLKGNVKVTCNVVDTEASEKVDLRLREINFDDLNPSSILKEVDLSCFSSGENERIPPSIEDLIWRAAQLLHVCPDVLFPICFAANGNGPVKQILGISQRLLSYVMQYDNDLPSDKLFLFTGDAGAEIVDTRKAFVITLPYP